MKINDLIAYLDARARVSEDTLDTVKAGNPDAPLTKVAVTMMATVDVIKAAADWGAELLIIGATVEWKVCEYARDAAAMGLNKSMIVMGHIGSEREGMKRLTKTLAAEHPDLEFRYFECGEVYL